MSSEHINFVQELEFKCEDALFKINLVIKEGRL